MYSGMSSNYGFMPMSSVMNNGMSGLVVIMA